MSSFRFKNRLGAELIAPDRTRFTLWAPSCERVFVEVEDLPPIAMRRHADGTFVAEAPCGAGARYLYRVRDNVTVPDPASRFQPDGVHGRSEILDPDFYDWKTSDWKGRPWEETIIYETHLGLEGNYEGMKTRLQELADLGITTVQFMPVNSFSGHWNWGYDGVLVYAPTPAYGRPEALKDLIDHAHSLGLMVFLDVVYNHFGPDGNYLLEYAKGFFDPRYDTPWGDGIDFHNPIVADFFIDNALYWLMEYRFDGLRIDAAWAITDRQWFYKLQSRIHKTVEKGRHVHLILENENNDAGLLRDGYSGQWSEDWHHTLTVMLSGEDKGFFLPFHHETTGLLKRVLTEGLAWQGEFFPPRQKTRGSPSSDLPPTKFVTFLQNHDQIGNRPLGERLITLSDPNAFKAAYALLLLCPMTPMLFLGEEWGSKTPFYFFSDFHGAIGEKVRRGREEQFAEYCNLTDPDILATLPSPTDPKTFRISRPDRAERDTSEGQAWLARTTELLALRHSRITPHLKGAYSAGADILGEKAIIASWTLGDGSLLTIAVNLGTDTVSLLEPENIFYETSPKRASQTLPPGTLVAALGRAF
ncbi:malto-oligosyltrehalose trehalohydrolase [Gluconobacter cerinus]|uniref:malto-oligosyltrehalose trehalohydrolase n=1 Tax=Gluconobacter cerinus TaxID=38307 RepID=UPI001B8B9206|nr:malto-oligosyltrehalose trehalohydrolase [Gluconobacter cerinus]MBS1037973.1 malto-oligosyltrehalose trehalohydrolase [Gluconobacter cerinus]